MSKVNWLLGAAVSVVIALPALAAPVAADRAASPPPALTTPGPVVALVRLGLPSSDGAVAYADLSSRRPLSDMQTFWMATVYPQDRAQAGLRAVLAGGPLIAGRWTKVEVDCSKRAHLTSGGVGFDAQGRMGQSFTTSSDGGGSPITLLKEQIAVAACDKDAFAGQPRLTRLTAAIAEVRKTP